MGIGMFKKIKKHLKIWWMMSRNSFSVVLEQKLTLYIFLTGKTLRFIFTFLFIFYLLKTTKGLAGYSSNQIIFFFLTFNVIDSITQFLFREVYLFRRMIIRGDFDLVLVKPVNSLFRVLMGGADIIDLITIPPIIGLTAYFGFLLNPGFWDIVLYILLLLNGLIIATAFHIAILALAIMTLEIDHTVMIYRDVVSLGKLPVDIYGKALGGVLTYIIPLGIMISLPAKAVMGLATPLMVLIALAVGPLAILVSLKFWKFSLTKYTSASS